jgi:predicted S18 family serine protease
MKLLKNLNLNQNPNQNLNQEEEEVDTTELESLIEKVEEEIWKGIDEFKDVDEAQNLLRRAKEALNAGDYDLAEELTQQALTLAMDARAEMPDVDVEDVEAEVTEVPEEVEEPVEEEAGMDWLLVIVGLVVLGVIAFFGYKFLNK